MKLAKAQISVADRERSRFKRQLRYAIARLKLEAAFWRLVRGAIRVFETPAGILDLPPYHPRRFFAAQIILYVGIGIVLLAAVLR